MIIIDRVRGMFRGTHVSIGRIVSIPKNKGTIISIK